VHEPCKRWVMILRGCRILTFGAFSFTWYCTVIGTIGSQSLKRQTRTNRGSVKNRPDARTRAQKDDVYGETWT